MKQAVGCRALLCCLVAALAVQGAVSARVLRKQLASADSGMASLEATSGAAVASAPWHARYRGDCFKKRPFLLAKGARVNSSAAMIPGAGMVPSSIVPFQTVTKDGYFYLDCYKDYLLYFGDKFGDNKYEYALGEVSNVSIVRYDELIPKQDREPMTHALCFEFCRTVPDMLFFGIQNGRSCYCMPYLKQMEGESSMCDAVCEGEKSTTCGGKTKSSIFEMHMCQQTYTDLEDAKEAMEAAGENLSAATAKLLTAADDMDAASGYLQEHCGKVGDPECAALGHSAKVHAGRLLEAVNTAEVFSENLVDMKEKAAAMSPATSKAAAALGHEEVEKVEALTKGMKEATGQAGSDTASLQALLAETDADLAKPTKNVTALYKDVMYFVNKSYLGSPSICSGAAAGDPMIGSLEGCANACEAKPRDCVGFQSLGNRLCFLFSKLKGTVYYTGCDSGMMEKVEGSAECMVKFSEFVGTSLAPDPSGKCKGCLKTAEEAARCIADED